MTDETIVNNPLTATKGEVTIVPEAFGKEALQDRVVEVSLKNVAIPVFIPFFYYIV